MHDRTSNKPPSLYTREEDAREHHSVQERITNLTQNRHASLDGIGAYYDAGIESSKSSSMYRVGKAIVNAFKPLSGWRGFGGGKEQPVSTEKTVLQARQIKAEKEYAELKKNGFVGTRAALAVPRITTVPAIRYEDPMEGTQSAPHRDSGIDMGSSRSSSERKSDGQVSQPDAGLVHPLLVPAFSRVPSPLSESSSPRKASVQFRKPSFQTLKKVKSHIQLPAAMRPTPPAPDSSFDYDMLKGATLAEQSVRKQPSRKEIVKQQRLSKKVSDLESQLEIARRNLKLSLNDASITPSTDLQTGVKAFVPGALPSLPSERALKAYIRPEKGENSSAIDSKQPLTTFSERQDPAQQIDAIMADPTAQLNQELQNSVFKQTESQQPRPKQNESKKRKGDARGDEDIGHNIDQVSEEGELDAKRPKLRRSMRPSTKTQKAMDADVSSRKKQNLNPRTPRNSPLKTVDPVPPLPAGLDFNPVKVDQAKIMSEDSKVTDHTSLSHHNQPAPSVLGPPCSASPIKTKPLKVPDPSPSTMSGQELPGLSPLMENDVKASTNGVVKAASLLKAENLSVSKSASTLRIKALHASAAKNEKPLPNIQKEEYEWPEDVF